MKENKRKLDLLLKFNVIDLNDFYTMSITNFQLTFQGEYTSQVVKKYINKGFKFEINSEGHTTAKRKNIDITFL